MLTLRPFQHSALDQYRAVWRRSTRHLGIAPTGFGKTIVLAYLAREIVPKVGFRFIVLAHRERLVNGNAAKIAACAPTLLVEIEAAEEVSERGDVISVSIASLRGDRLAACAARWREDGRPLFVVVDEAHHATAASYREALEVLAPDRLLGLTATPERADDEGGVRLREVFDEIAFVIERGAMIDDGWLARPRQWAIPTGQSLATVAIKGGDYVSNQLEGHLNVLARNNLIVAAAADAASLLTHPVAGVCFCLSVAHAKGMAVLFRERLGWDAAAIVGETPPEVRDEWDARLARATRPTIVTTCDALSEGWDVESLNLGLFARPTRSRLLADQMIGRLLRISEKKTETLLIDFLDGGDDDDGRATVARSFGLPVVWSGEGAYLRDDQVWFDEQLVGSSYLIRRHLWKAAGRSAVGRLLEGQEVINDFAAAFPSERGFLWWDLGKEIRLVVDTGSVVIVETPLGEFAATWRQARETTPLATYQTVLEAQASTERWVSLRFPSKVEFLRNASADDPREATAKQKTAMKRLGLAVYPGLTVGEARLSLALAAMEGARLLEDGRCAFGRYRGQRVDRLPTKLLEWGVSGDGRTFLEGRKRPELRLFQEELARRAILRRPV